MSQLLFPDDHKYFTFLKKVFRHEFRKNGFRRISTPNFINWVMRKNAQEGIMKAYLEHNIAEEIQPVYYYYIDCFRNGDIEENRIWGDIIWENDPILDVILIYVMFSALNKIWLKDDFEIKINSAWIEKEKVKYKEELINFYSDKKHILTPESLALLDKDPILLLKSENEDEIILAKSAPNFLKFLKKDSKAHYDKVKEYLELLKIPFTEDNTLVWDESYITNTIWSFTDKDNWKIIASWYRYNTLSTQMWEPKEIPATGFYANADLVIDMVKRKNIAIKNKDSIDLFIIQLWDEAKKIVLPISIEAREAWINTVVSLWTPSMKEQMLKSQRLWSKFIVMVWIMEARNWIFQVRDNVAGTQAEVKKEELIDYIIWKIWKESLDFYCPAKDLIQE